MKNITLHYIVILRAPGNVSAGLGFHCALTLMMDQSATLCIRGSACSRQDSSQHLAPMCRGLAPLNHTMQGQLTNRIGVFRHRSAALFKCANRIRGICRLPVVSKTSEFKRGREALAKPRERRTLAFQLPAMRDV
jgi:hypothetical protein